MYDILLCFIKLDCKNILQCENSEIKKKLRQTQIYVLFYSNGKKLQVTPVRNPLGDSFTKYTKLYQNAHTAQAKNNT